MSEILTPQEENKYLDMIGASHIIPSEEPEEKSIKEEQKKEKKVPLVEALAAKAIKLRQEAAPSQKQEELPGELPVTATRAFGRGVAEGATFGGSDELYAALAATAESMGDLSAPATSKDPLENKRKWLDIYRQNQQEQQTRQEKLREAFPKTYMGGELVGSAVPFAASAATGGTAVLGAGTTAKAIAALGGKGAAQKIGAGVVEGLLGGTATGALTSKGKLLGASPEEKEQFLSDVKTGAIAGTVLGGTFGTGSYLAEDVPYLRQSTSIPFKRGLGWKGAVFDEASEIIDKERNNFIGIAVPKIENLGHKLGKDLEDVLQQTEQRGITFSPTPSTLEDIEKASSEIVHALRTNKDVHLGGLEGDFQDLFYSLPTVLAGKAKDTIEFAKLQNVILKNRSKISALGDEDLAQRLFSIDKEITEGRFDKLVMDLEGRAKDLPPEINEALAKFGDKATNIYAEQGVGTILKPTGIRKGTKLPLDFPEEGVGKPLFTPTDLSVQPGPTRIYKFRKDLSDVLAREQGKDPAFSRAIVDLRKALRKGLEETDPSITKTMERYSDFQSMVPETLLSDRLPPEIMKKYQSELQNSGSTVAAKLGTIIDKAGEQWESGQNAFNLLNDFKSGMQQFESKYPGLLQSAGIDREVIIAKAKELADAQAIRHTHYLSGTGVLATAKKAPAIGINLLGQAVAAPFQVPKAILSSDVSKAIYNATPDTLKQLASSLKLNKVGSMLGSALERAIDKGDTVAKNAVLFAIMQNPSTRKLVSDTSSSAITPLSPQ